MRNSSFNSVPKVLQIIFKYSCSLILLLLFSIPLILALPIFFFRFFVSYVIVPHYPKIDKLILSRSAAFAVDELFKKPKCSLVPFFFVEGNVDIHQVRQVLSSRLIEQKDEFGKLLKPEFQQFLTDFWGFSAWEWETDFDIEYHVRMYDGIHKDDITDGATLDKLQDVVTELLFKPFERQKSPWIVHIVPNFTETGSPAELKQTALLLQTHHSLGDGFSFIKAFTKDLTAEEAVQAELFNHIKPKFQKTLVQRIGSAVDFILSVPYELLTEVISASDGINDWHVREDQLQGSMNGGFSQLIAIDYFKEIKARHKVTFTALIFECFTAAMRKFMIEAGAKVPKVIHCGAPLPMPGHPNQMTNHMTGCFITLPVGLSDPLRRFEAIQSNLDHIRNLSYPVALFYLNPLVGSLFSCILRGIVRNFLTTAIMSNLPGPTNAIEIANLKIRTMSFVGGFLKGNCGMGFGAMSYNGTLRIAAGLDNGIVDKNKLSAKKLVDYFLEEAELLKKLAPVV